MTYVLRFAAAVVMFWMLAAFFDGYEGSKDDAYCTLPSAPGFIRCLRGPESPMMALMKASPSYTFGYWMGTPRLPREYDVTKPYDPNIPQPKATFNGDDKND